MDIHLLPGENFDTLHNETFILLLVSILRHANLDNWMIFLLAGRQKVLLQVSLVLRCVELIDLVQNIRIFPRQQSDDVIYTEYEREDQMRCFLSPPSLLTSLLRQSDT